MSQDRPVLDSETSRCVLICTKLPHVLLQMRAPCAESTQPKLGSIAFRSRTFKPTKVFLLFKQDIHTILSWLLSKPEMRVWFQSRFKMACVSTYPSACLLPLAIIPHKDVHSPEFA